MAEMDDNNAVFIRILIALPQEQQTLIRDMLDSAADCEIVGTTTSGQQVITLAGESHPDIVIIGFQLADAWGPEICLQLTKTMPVGVIIIAAPQDENVDSMRFSAMAGASFYFKLPPNQEPFLSKIRETHQRYVRVREYRANHPAGDAAP